MSRKYNVKCSLEDFHCISEGLKSFDVRMNDCKYELGDILVEQEYKDGVYTGRFVERKVVWIQSLGDIKPLVEHVGTWAGHFVVLGLASVQ